MSLSDSARGAPPSGIALDPKIRAILGTNPHLTDTTLLASWQYVFWMIGYCVVMTLFGVLSIVLLPDPDTLERIRQESTEDLDYVEMIESAAERYDKKDDDYTTMLGAAQMARKPTRHQQNSQPSTSNHYYPLHSVENRDRHTGTDQVNVNAEKIQDDDSDFNKWIKYYKTNFAHYYKRMQETGKKPAEQRGDHYLPSKEVLIPGKHSKKELGDRKTHYSNIPPPGMKPVSYVPAVSKENNEETRKQSSQYKNDESKRYIRTSRKAASSQDNSDNYQTSSYLSYE